VITLALLSGYAITLAFVLHLLGAARRREKAMTPTAPAAPRPRRLRRPQGMTRRAPTTMVLGADPDLGRLAAAVHDTLDVKRVAVVVTDADKPGTGVVAACLGVPGLLGNRLPLVAEPATGLLTSGEVADLGFGDSDHGEEPWAFAQLPITGTDDVLGAVTVASQRDREFDDADLRVLERLAREQAPRFDRRSHALLPRAIAR
jgi:GAF domain